MFSIDIPNAAWEPCPSTGGVRYWLAEFRMNGVSMHAQAFPVGELDDAHDYDEPMLAGVQAALDDDYNYSTATVHGQQCVIVCTPFAR